ncbi:DUF6520 family protein [Chryseolinea lacunae]|uniref:Uncharacterized protein n=1 Tax=Chryseolinea lacunae TaxID=2801331 RepID=A0ABS1KZG7_9BACT|nr:DUF6520 family protein [Chryseolinea lacunae]MBL0744850.1 hypothetical protein [Chryseolinea lacunae]
MKRFILKFLPAVAFVFAAGVAVVAHGSVTRPEGVLKAKINGTWQPISEGQGNCLTSADECKARFNAQNQMIQGSLVPGTYVSQ